MRDNIGVVAIDEGRQQVVVGLRYEEGNDGG